MSRGGEKEKKGYKPKNFPLVECFGEGGGNELDAIAKQLQALEHDSQKTDAIIADFCKELGIVSPFSEVK